MGGETKDVRVSKRWNIISKEGVGERSENAEAVLQDGRDQSGKTLKHPGVKLTVSSEKCLAREKCTFTPLCLFVHDDGDNDQLAALQYNIADELSIKNLKIQTVSIGEERRHEAQKMQVTAKRVKEKQEQRENMAKAGKTSKRSNGERGERSDGSVPSSETFTHHGLRLSAGDQSENQEQQEREWQERKKVALVRPVSNSLMLKAKKIKEKREQQERMKESEQQKRMKEKESMTELVTVSTEEMARSEVKKMREVVAKQGLVERIGSSPIYSTTMPTWQYLTDRQLDKVGDSRLGQSEIYNTMN